MIPTRENSPHVPVTVDEIVACCRQVVEAGASVLHLHARDQGGFPTSDGAAYVTLVDRVRSACPEAIICVSLSGRRISDVESRAAPLAACPDMASLTMGSMNFPGSASVNAPETITELASRIHAIGAVPELEVFEAGFVNYASYLISKNVLHPPHFFNLILGSLGAAPVDLLGLGHMVSLLPKGSTWSVGGIGRFQLDANVLALAAGGHVRVGLEDNLYFDRQRSVLADNPGLVERIVRIARDMGREPATPAEARSIIGLP